jgi:hypothetical protein
VFEMKSSEEALEELMGGKVRVEEDGGEGGGGGEEGDSGGDNEQDEGLESIILSL